MGKRKDPKQLYKLLVYVLGCRPDEFGLVPDQNGFVPIKDLIKSITEEPGWGYVRKSHLNEVFLLFRDHPFAFEGAAIKVTQPRQPLEAVPVDDMPKLLYHAVRRKAYPVVCRHGIMPMGQHHVFLATSEELALRMGRRKDPRPVLLTVRTQQALEVGIAFRRQGKLLFTAEHIPVGCFTGPPLPEEKTKEKTKTHVKVADKGAPVEPGSFPLDMTRSEELQRQAVRRKGIKKEIAWKKEVRKTRRKRR
jgi:putative RNA 2'-phosphotransferase